MSRLPSNIDSILNLQPPEDTAPVDDESLDSILNFVGPPIPPTETRDVIYDGNINIPGSNIRIFTGKHRERLLEQWSKEYDLMGPGEYRDKYGELLEKARSADRTARMFNDPLLLRAGETANVRGGIGIISGGLAIPELVLSVPGVSSIPGSQNIKNSISSLRNNLQSRAATFESKEQEYDKESLIGETAAGITRDLSGVIGELSTAMGLGAPLGAAKTIGTLPVAGEVSGGLASVASYFGAKSAADSLHRRPDDPGLAVLHGMIDGAGTLLLGRFGEGISKFGSNIAPQAAKAVANKYSLTPVLNTLASAGGGASDMALIEATNYLTDTALTKDKFNWDELSERLLSGVKSGALLGGAFGAVPSVVKFKQSKFEQAAKELAETMKKREGEIENAAKAIEDAREVYRKSQDVEAGIQKHFESMAELPEGYREYFDGELNNLKTVEADYRTQESSINSEASKVSRQRAQALDLIQELNGIDRQIKDGVAPKDSPMVQEYLIDRKAYRSKLDSELADLHKRQSLINAKKNKLTRGNKSVKEFVESEVDRLSNEKAVVTEKNLHEQFTKSLDEAAVIEEQIAQSGKYEGAPENRVIEGESTVPTPEYAGPQSLSMSNRNMNRLRDFYELDKVDKSDAISWITNVENATERGYIEKAVDLARAHKEQSKLLNTDEFAGIKERIRLDRQKYDQYLDEMINTEDQAKKAVIFDKMEDIRMNNELLTEVAIKDNSNVGRRLNAAKMKLTNQYDPLTLQVRGARSKGDDLTAEQADYLRNVGSEITKLEEQVSKTPEGTKQRDRLEYQLFQNKTKAHNYVLGLEPKGFVKRADQAIFGLQDIMRGMKLSADASFVGLQGGVGLVTHPVSVAKGFSTFVKSLKSREQAFTESRRILNRSKSNVYERAELGLMAPDSPLTAREWGMVNEFSRNIPVVSRLEDAYVAGVNRMRAEMFDSMLRSIGGEGAVGEVGLKAIGRFVNSATGRGSLGGFESSARTLSSIFLSPRWFASRFQYLYGTPISMAKLLAAGETTASKLIAKEYAKSIGFWHAAMGAAAVAAEAAYPGQVKAHFNPLDPKWGLLDVADKSIDMSAGFRTPVVLALQPVAAAAGLTEPLDAARTIGYSAGGRLAPFGRIAVESTSGKKLGSGEPTNFGWSFGSQFVAIPATNVYDALKHDGLSATDAMSVGGDFIGVPGRPNRDFNAFNR